LVVIAAMVFEILYGKTDRHRNAVKKPMPATAFGVDNEVQ